MSTTKTALKVTGISLIGYALAPTPDDVTVIAPITLLATGITMLFIGNMIK